jgi:uncharacterized protein (DUF952 family)
VATLRNRSVETIRCKYNLDNMMSASTREANMTRYESSEDSRAAGVTYHLVPVDVWDKKKHRESYIPDAFEQDGFIHCTNGLDELVAVGNRYYSSDPRPFMALVLDMDEIESPVRYDDPNETFPHIYGPLNSSAIIGTLLAVREVDGTFRAFEDA